jgi:hypothetical protein
MTEEERTFVRHMINQTIERLQKASMGANHMGSRYARLLQLLWRKPPKHNNHRGSHRPSIDARLKPPNPNDPPSSSSSSAPQNQQPFDPSSGFGNMGQMGVPPGGGSGFSWLDLGATWNFATQNGNNSSSGSTGDLQDEGPGINELSPFDMSLLTDYSLLEGDNPNLIF